MNNYQIIQCYGRYLESLKCDNANVFSNYEKMYNYIINKIPSLARLLIPDCAEMTLKAVASKNISFNQRGLEWNQARIKKFFNCLNAIQAAETREDTDALKVLNCKILQLIMTEEAVNMQLYMFSKYKYTNCGKRLLTNGRVAIKAMLEAPTEEELELMLAEELPATTEPTVPTEEDYNPEKILTQLTDLYSKYNPQTAEEAKENLQELKDAFSDGQLTKNAYYAAKNFLNAMVGQYARGLAYKQPTSKKLQLLEALAPMT